MRSLGRLRDEFVADATHGQDPLWMIRIGFELLSQPADMNVDHLRLTDEFGTPNLT